MALWRRKLWSPLKFAAVIIIGYMLFQFAVTSRLLSYGETTRAEQHGDWPQLWQSARNSNDSNMRNSNGSNRLPYNSKRITSHGECQSVVSFGLVLLNVDDVTNAAQLLKSALFYRKSAIVLHVVASSGTKRSFQTLLTTWQLMKVVAVFYDLPDGQLSTVDAELSSQLLRTYYLPSVLPEDNQTVAVLDSRVRFLAEPEGLMRILDEPVQKHFIALAYNRGSDIKHPMLEVVVLRARGLRSRLPAGEGHTRDQVIALYESLSSRGELKELACSWNVHLSSSFQVPKCLQGQPAQAVVVHEDHLVFSGLESLEAQKEMVSSLHSENGDLFRYQSPSLCQPVPPPPQLPRHTTKCAEYEYNTNLTRRTHLYLTGSMTLYGDNDNVEHDAHGVSITTQLTMDRFEVLEKFIQNWDGPAHMVVHGTDAEANDLVRQVKDSKVFSKRKNIAFHFVFKRGRYYPINYLRNVGLREVRTPYVLHVDVDLVPVAGLYGRLKAALESLPTPNTTLIVPAFEAFSELEHFPKNKSELLELIKNKKAGGFRMNRGWNLGHRPTNFDYWMSATESYKVKWADAFEPYMVLPTRHLPLYDETLLERMGDKIAYGREVYARGYTMMVLPQEFVLHLPHPVSRGTLIWRQESRYFSCGAALFNEFKRNLEKRYPLVRFK